MPEEPELRHRPKKVTIGPLEITRKPRTGYGEYFHVKVAALVGLLLIALHDGVYRQTQPDGQGDFELWGTISHAGLDMLGVVAVTAAVLVLVEWGRIK